MDPKASAKSRRTHSQQGRRNHPTPAAIAQKKKAAQTAGEEKTPRTQHSQALPSNWDRYDGGGEGADDTAGTKQGDGEVVPKSKGADFGYLIEQARSQPPEYLYSGSMGSSTLDDLSLDFMQGVSSMLSVRGKGLSSWCGDDNFIVDDDLTSSYEVPFLSMDLHALAAQLSKLKLSQRLFIEADLLPEELCIIDESRKSPISEQSETSKINESKHGSDSPAFLSIEDCEMTQVQGAAVEKDQPQTSPTWATRLEPSKCSKPQEQSGRKVEDSILQISNHAMTDLEQNKTSRFEAAAAAAAEAELDILLDTFSETNLSGSKMAGIINDNSARKSSTFGSLAPTGLRSIDQDPGSSRNMTTTSIDDSIDACLDDSSLCLTNQKHTARPLKGGVVSTILPSSLGSGSMAACTSSRHVARTAALDDGIDDLLAETSVFIQNQKQHATFPPKEGATSSSVDHPSRACGLGPKAMDDLDSWLDTL